MKNLILIPLFVIVGLLGFHVGASTQLECSSLCGCNANLGCSCVLNSKTAECKCDDCNCKSAKSKCCKEAK